jgi:hypothetical protein
MEDEEGTDDDKSTILDAALGLAQTQLSAQVADDASLDGRTTGLIGLNGALLAADFAIKGVLGTLWYAPLFAVVVSTAFLVPTLFGVDRKGLDFAARAAVFYTSQGTRRAIAARELLLAELDNAFGFNVDRLTRKRTRLQLSLVALLGGLILAGLLIRLDQPTRMVPCPKRPHSRLQSKHCNSPSRNSRTRGQLGASPNGDHARGGGG